ncbi:hypothetical protein Tco_1401765 [Tanacetum coccineum]
MFIELSFDGCIGYLKGGSGNSGGKRLAISMVEEAWLSEKEETKDPIDRGGGNIGQVIPPEYAYVPPESVVVSPEHAVALPEFGGAAEENKVKRMMVVSMRVWI